MENCSKFVSDRTGTVLFLRKNGRYSCSESYETAYRLIFQTKATVEYIDADNDFSTNKFEAKASADGLSLSLRVPAAYGESAKLLEITYSIENGITTEEIENSGSGLPADTSGGSDLCIANFVVTVDQNSSKWFPTVTSITCDKTDDELLAAWENGNLVAYVTDENYPGYCYSGMSRKIPATIYKTDGGSDWICWYFALEYSLFSPGSGLYDGEFAHRRVLKGLDGAGNSCNQMLIVVDHINSKISITASAMTKELT